MKSILEYKMNLCIKFNVNFNSNILINNKYYLKMAEGTMITSLCWVSKGYAKNIVEEYNPT